MATNEVRLKARTLRQNWKNRIKKVYKKDVETFEAMLTSLPSIDEVEEYLRTTDLTTDYLTGETIPQGKYELDHRQPLSRRGELLLSNVGVCTKRNNKMKGDLTYNEYMSLIALINSWEIDGKKALERRLNQATTIFRGYSK